MTDFSTQQAKQLAKLLGRPPCGLSKGTAECFFLRYVFLEALVRLVGRYYRERSTTQKGAATEDSSLNVEVVKRSLKHFGVLVDERRVDAEGKPVIVSDGSSIGKEMSTLEPHVADESEIAKMLEDVDLDASTLERFAFRSFKINRMVALHPNASAELLARLAKSPDKPTRRNVALNAQTSKEVLLSLAPTFAGEFFLNPVFDLLLLEDPNLLFGLPVTVLKNILKRTDCPESILNWASRYGDKSHQLALVSRTDISKELLERVANGPHVKPAELAAGRLMAW